MPLLLALLAAGALQCWLWTPLLADTARLLKHSIAAVRMQAGPGLPKGSPELPHVGFLTLVKTPGSSTGGPQQQLQHALTGEIVALNE